MKKVTVKKAIELTSQYDAINEAALSLVDTNSTPEQYLKSLIDNKLFEDAIVFLSHSLPVRECIWWGCVCARKVTNKETSADNVAALNIAEKWVYEPGDNNRRLCGKLAEKLDYKSAHSWVAAAVFWSGGSILEPNEPSLEPAPYLYAHAVSGAILTAVGSDESLSIEDEFNQYLQHGINIANGGNA